MLLVREGAVLGLFWGVKASLPGNLDLQHARQHLIRAVECHGMLSLNSILSKHSRGLSTNKAE